MPEYIDFVPCVDVDVSDDELLLYGRMEDARKVAPEQRVGARIGSGSRCTICGKAFAAGQHITADLAPNMAGTARHTDCVLR